MNEVEEKWKKVNQEVRKCINDNKIEKILIPNWEPVEVESGLNWIRNTIYEGYFVKWEVIEVHKNKYLKLINWEFGAEEPSIL